MNLEKTRNIAIKLMKEHGLTNYTFKWDKAVGRFGQHNGWLKTISLSRPLTLHESNEDRVINTILHEIAHALDYKKRGFSNHDSEWVRLAKSIGCSGKRCSSGSGVDKSMTHKWVVSCSECGLTHYRARKSKRAVACGSCCKKHNGGKYTSKYNFNWELNPKVIKYK